ncbi:MAG TPA: FkbM family methyltransferase [Polyangiaceae bacterium]
MDLVRAITKHVPVRIGATLMNVGMSALGRNGRQPIWRVSDGVGSYPAMEVNVSSPFQRRMYYFPRAYWERLMGLPFGKFLASTVEPGSVFFDIGANIGFYTLFAAMRVGAAGRVCSFEPDPVTFESLSRSVKRNGFGWASCMNLALSDRRGELPFYFVDDGSAHSLVPEVPERQNRYSGNVRVEVTTLDDLVREGRVDASRIDLVKIDVEGEEARTVAGMRGTLETAHFPRVWVEVRGPRGSTRAPNTFPAVRRGLEQLGYAAFLWSRGSLRKVTDRDIRGRHDVLFVRG